jgi:hypothetical protein
MIDRDAIPKACICYRSRTNRACGTMKKGPKVALIVAGAVSLPGLVVFTAWGGELTPLGSDSEALAAIASNANVRFQEEGDVLALIPIASTSSPGFILYPPRSRRLSVVRAHRAGARRPGMLRRGCRDAALARVLRPRYSGRRDRSQSLRAAPGHRLLGTAWHLRGERNRRPPSRHPRGGLTPGRSR